MNRMFHTFATLVLLACGVNAFAQITYGGSPWTLGERPEAVLLPALDREALAAEDRVTDRYKEAPWRFGVEHDVLWDAQDCGAWTVERGHWVWRLVIQAEGTTGLSVRFGTFEVPKGGELFLHSPDGEESLGALTHRNMKDWGGLATGLLATDVLVLEYRQPLELSDWPRLVIDQVVQGYRALSGWPHGVHRGPFGNSGQCNINVNCPEGTPWATEKRSVALIVQGGFAVCTGALVNNTLNDGTPYFLTANHCLGNPGNWLYYFNHESATCAGSSGPVNQSVSGGTTLVSSAQSDVALIELSQTPPDSYNVQYAGWDASGSIPSSAVGIHHPSGDVKKICFEDDSPYQSTAGGAQVWWIDQWELGVTEPGSSGSPLFDSNHRIIGQLYGGAAACAGTTNNGQYDFYGRFDVSWNVGLDEYLNPAGIDVNVWDGFPEGVASLNNDAAIAITGGPSTVLCATQDVAIEVTLTNTGSNTLTSCMLTYQVNGGAPLQQSWAGTLEPFESELVVLPAFQAQNGINSVEINVNSPNGVADENGFNNTANVEFTTLEGPTFNYSLDLVLDNDGSETTWTLNRLGETLFTGGPYEDGANGQTESVEFCLEAGCYQFVINDSFGDGMCCDWGNGGWTLSGPDGAVVGSGGSFGFSDNVDFCTPETSEAYDLGQPVVWAFPNPADSEIRIDWPRERGVIRVLDVTGREVLLLENEQRTSIWDTSAWPEGTYVAAWKGPQGQSSVVRLTIVH